MTKPKTTRDEGTPAQFGRLGRRGSCLLFFGLLDVIYSYGLLTHGPATPGSQAAWLTSFAPLWVWAMLWLAVGMVLLVHAWKRRDQVGFAAAIFLKLLWGVLNLGGFLAGDFPRGYISAAIWLPAAGLVWVISGWREPGNGRGPTWTSPSSPPPRP